MLASEGKTCLCRNMLANDLQLSVPLWYLGSRCSLGFSWGLSLEDQLSSASSVLPQFAHSQPLSVGGAEVRRAVMGPDIPKCQPYEAPLPKH